MCGLVGFLGSNKGRGVEFVPSLLNTMADRIEHRGPDGAGYWHSDSGIAFAHRRLAIQDLSPAGDQPMQSACGRYVFVFNGEIYNHRELRLALETASLAHVWRGHSDTETMLAGFSVWGIRATIERCTGMFAFAVWDKQKRVLTLGRDRIGEKPLYYGWQGEGSKANFLFGSELKALRAHPEFNARINRNALSLYMSKNYVPAPFSIYEGIYKLLPGHLLTVSLQKTNPVVERYWSLPHIANNGVIAPYSGTDGQAIRDLDELLDRAVGEQMIADVPIGAFLSGGVDSSTVVALMQKHSSQPVKTFSIGFSESSYNEAPYANAVAKHLGTDHTELYVSPTQALDIIPKLPLIFCEPLGDSSQIPTYLVSQLARQKVNVSLSGDAGDELFAGYNRYVMTQKMWSTLERVPPRVKRMAASGILTINPNRWDQMLEPLQRFVPHTRRVANIGDKLHKAAGVMNAQSATDLYQGLVSHWPTETVLGGSAGSIESDGAMPESSELDAIQQMMLMDGLGYLPDNILAKVDRAAMAVSLEARVPFLNHRVIEFAWRLPQAMKIRGGVGKWILRQVLYQYVPQKLIDRPKTGFSVPIDSWLRGPLREWAEELLEESRVKQEGFFNPILVRQKWMEHLSGERNWQSQLWSILMFQAWLEDQIN